jgi:hypothetical protein
MLRIQRGLPEENPFTGVSYFELYIGRYVSQPMMWLHIPVSRSTRPGHGCKLKKLVEANGTKQGKNWAGV